MRKMIYGGLFLALVGIGFISCEKEDDLKNEQEINAKENKVQVNKKSLSSGIQVEFSYNDTINILTGENFKSQLRWMQIDGTNENTENTIGNINIDYNDLGQINITELREDRVVLSTELGEFSFLINNQNESELFMTITGSSNRVLDFKLKDSKSSLQSLFDNYIEGEDIIIDDADETYIWPLVYAAASLIAAGIDYYCDSTIVSQVDSCTSSGQCSIVNSCSATCVACCTEC